MTDNCAATIAEGKHGDFAEHNHLNALTFRAACVLIALKTTLIVNTILLILSVLIVQIYSLYI